jgi:V/A-type H+-transporting ATPase subunit A
VAVTDERRGVVSRIDGPVVEIEGLEGASMFDLVLVGDAGLPGEVIRLEGRRAVAQVYEYSGGVAPGDAVVCEHRPLSVRLGPGLLGGVFDGLMRRLDDAPDLLQPGGIPLKAPARERFHFSPSVDEGDTVGGGTVLGTLDGEGGPELSVLVPPGHGGIVEGLVDEGDYREDDVLAVVGGREVTMGHEWPVRRPRPTTERLAPTTPLVTGQRVLDLVFPVRLGSTAAIPGGFGTGKTVTLQQVAKWSDVDVIVYVGCGERGNEMADLVGDFEHLEHPRTGGRLLDRVVLVANTSNMPVIAREVSIHVGVTVAEFFRDMGLDALVIADSTSRWAEALREIASRTGQLPAEEGFPASLASSLAAFYERAGHFRTLAGREGSVSILGAVSPPGGDMTEPVTAHTRRFVRAVWSLDRDLAYARHYPAVSWRASFSRDAELLEGWYAGHDDAEWGNRRRALLDLLAEADRLTSIADLVGVGTLPDRERVVLLVARLIREGLLQQNALVANDESSSPAKGRALATVLLDVHDACLALLDRQVPASALEEFDFGPLLRAREQVGPDDVAAVEAIGDTLLSRLEELT